MTASQIQLNENREKQLGRLEEAIVAEMPALASAMEQVWSTTYTEGELSSKVKRLVAMALALGSGCRNCVLAQTKLALEQGATRREFLETLAVVISMRGTTGIAESLRVVQFLDEQGVW
ncbi:carboxymuconolactone decarboxylase family protein [Candidatus Bipolaricaulota bacterium]